MSAARYRDDFYYYPPAQPRQARGGIKAQTKRGAFGQSWWARRWIQVLEGFNIGARLGRGRNYARRGQVVSISIAEGEVTAKVQGTRPTPYRVTIQMKTLSPAAWKKVITQLSGQAIHAANLLSGRMPDDIESVFKATGQSLFPAAYRDLLTDCSCPDWSNPCKHIAAAYYLLGEEFDRDPFLIFKLRGMPREKLLELLGAETDVKHEAKVHDGSGASTATGESSPPAEPLPPSAASFWALGDLPDDFAGEAVVPVLAAALPRRLGAFPFWRGAQPFLEEMERTYALASVKGLHAFLGEPESVQAGNGLGNGLSRKIQEKAV
ncbi:MAG: SWIM zinc finger family protein [Desulfarculus sp.]|nr:SWIM zinc finger family protein [Desulfarculus sp.]